MPAAAAPADAVASSRASRARALQKIRLQSQQQQLRVGSARPKYTGYFSTGRVIAAEEGLRVLFLRGMTASMLRELLYSTLRIGLYEPAKHVFQPGADGDIGLTRKILAGMASGAIGSAIANPTDLIKVRRA